MSDVIKKIEYIIQQMDLLYAAHYERTSSLAVTFNHLCIMLEADEVKAALDMCRELHTFYKQETASAALRNVNEV